MSMQYISEILPSLFQGAALTLQIFFWTLVGSLPLGILVSLGLTSKIKPLKWILEIYVWLMRGNAFAASTDLCILWVTNYWHCF